MKIESVIKLLEKDVTGSKRGVTASPGHRNYENAKDLNFQLHQCAQRDPEWEYPEYIAKTDRGAIIYIGCDERRKIISCGRKGYHSSQYHGDSPCI